MSGEAQPTDLNVVTIDSITPDGMQFADFSSTSSKVVLSLRMTNRHIHTWAYNKHESFVSQLNKSIDGSVVKIDNHCDRIEKNLSSKARKIKSQLKKSSGRHHQHILEQPYNLFILEDELESFESITSERDLAIARAEEWRAEAQLYKDETNKLLEDMATDILTFSDELELQSARFEEVRDQQNPVNKGKMIEDVSPRQARRKVAQVTTLSKQALWFAHSFGLQPESVQFRKVASQSLLTVQLDDHSESGTPQPPGPSQVDIDRVHQVLYLLDKFAVSDEVYHELTMLCSDLPASHRVKAARNDLNEQLEFERLPPPYPGAYRCFEKMLADKISTAVSIS